MTDIVRVMTVWRCETTQIQFWNCSRKRSPKELSTDKNYARTKSKIGQSRKSADLLIE